jgi:hypothetical protein
MAHEKKTFSISPKAGNLAFPFLLVGDKDWPFPVPLVTSGSKLYFDSKAGREELLYRRIGSNELDALQICNGYVEAQEEYALQPRRGYEVNQYAQRASSARRASRMGWRGKTLMEPGTVQLAKISRAPSPRATPPGRNRITAIFSRY